LGFSVYGLIVDEGSKLSEIDQFPAMFAELNATPKKVVKAKTTTEA